MFLFANRHKNIRKNPFIANIKDKCLKYKPEKRNNKYEVADAGVIVEKGKKEESLCLVWLFGVAKIKIVEITEVRMLRLES